MTGDSSADLTGVLTGDLTGGLSGVTTNDMTGALLSVYLSGVQKYLSALCPCGDKGASGGVDGDADTMGMGDRGDVAVGSGGVEGSGVVGRTDDDNGGAVDAGMNSGDDSGNTDAKSGMVVMVGVYCIASL